MGASRKRRGTGSRTAGAVAGVLAFGLGGLSLFYFVELRGAGVRVELAGARGLELMIVAGVVVIFALVSYLTVAALARRGGDEPQVQHLLQLAHELDVTEPNALRAFDSVPALRDVVAQLVTEKAHARELSDRLETVRGEIGGIAEGMRRSSQDLGHLREENLSAASMQVVLLWNGLVDRVRQAEAARSGSPTGASAGDDAAQPDIGALVARLDELESELGRLSHAVTAPAALAPPVAATAVDTDSWIVPEQESVPALEIEPTARGWREPATAPPAEPAVDWSAESWPQTEEAPTISARELFLDDDTLGPEEGFAQVAPEPQQSRAEVRTAPDPFAPRSLLPDEFGESTVPGGRQASFQPQPQAPRQGSRPVSTTARSPVAPARPPVAPARPPVAPARSHVAPARPAAPAPPLASAPHAAPAPSGFVLDGADLGVEGMQFPEFVGGPERQPDGRVELTYENQTGDEVADLPASALLFDSEEEVQTEDGIFDLRSFGATEGDK